MQLYSLAEKILKNREKIQKEEKNIIKKGFLKFTKKEISKMRLPENFFIVDEMIVPYRIRKDKNCESREASYRKNGISFWVSAKTEKELKEKFLKKLKESLLKKNTNGIPFGFDDFSNFYFENKRKKVVAERTFTGDINRYKNHIRPFFGNINITEITRTFCENYMKSLPENTKTKDECHSLLNMIFKEAILYKIIKDNPLDAVLHIQHEKKHGKALTKEEENRLLSETAGTPYQMMFALVLYCGLRPNEYKTAVIENDFIKARNSKRKTKTVEYKYIPITPMLRPYIADLKQICIYTGKSMRKKFKEIFQDKHILYDLRTTFYTRLQQCDISELARKEFMGHSLPALEKAYTDLSSDFIREYLKNEAEKFKY